MNRHPLDREAIEQKRRADERAQKLAEQQIRADIQQLMNLPAGRRILWAFMEQAGLDSSPFSPNAMTQSHAIGLQDGAKWWLNLIRAHCPEKEAQIRVEGMEMVRAQLKESNEEDDQ